MLTITLAIIAIALGVAGYFQARRTSHRDAGRVLFVTTALGLGVIAFSAVVRIVS